MSFRKDTFGLWQKVDVVVEVAPTIPASVVVPTTATVVSERPASATPATGAASGRSTQKGHAQRQPAISELMSRRASLATPQPAVEAQSEATLQVVVRAQRQRYHQNLFGIWVPVVLNEDANTPPPAPFKEMSFPTGSTESLSAPGKERSKLGQLKGRISRHSPYAAAAKHQTTINGMTTAATATSSRA